MILNIQNFWRTLHYGFYLEDHVHLIIIVSDPDLGFILYCTLTLAVDHPKIIDHKKRWSNPSFAILQTTYYFYWANSCCWSVFLGLTPFISCIHTNCKAWGELSWILTTTWVVPYNIEIEDRNWSIPYFGANSCCWSVFLGLTPFISCIHTNFKAWGELFVNIDNNLGCSIYTDWR